MEEKMEVGVDISKLKFDVVLINQIPTSGSKISFIKQNGRIIEFSKFTPLCSAPKYYCVDTCSFVMYSISKVLNPPSCHVYPY
jgi:vacuolar-type H+-ATPase subunit I/STV1